ncbi:hypothetical protein PR048_026874 [Dryococelus australis]|uniref:Uncharacterized protein n=1 Tax=Dryococelus australis TaxID=614101 RepID=A0ABQ9GMI4_9NEOP|nr:hypothetical protein PR048_026874 [Dryococelus australis]
MKTEKGNRRVQQLPPLYTNVSPCFVSISRVSCRLPEDILSREVPQDTDPSWVAFNTADSCGCDKLITPMEVMPLFTEKAQSLAKMLHTMNVVKAVVEQLNPGQIPVLEADAPLYAILKKIQFTMADSVLKASHIKRSRYAPQLTAAAIHILRQLAYQEHKENDTDLILSLSDWHTKMRAEQPMLQYWDIVLKTELCILTLLQSIRETNFQLCVNSLIRLAPWFFRLDHTNYARWLTVHIQYLICIEDKHLDIAQAFQTGGFVARKTMRPFSVIALDHTHEHINAM